MQSEVILVDQEDQELGRMEKLEAHRDGVLHRAFSVLVFNSVGEMLIQQRAENKYHSAGLWSNACCSHPAPGETVLEAAKRRLIEEIGLTCEIEPLFNLVYRIDFENGLTEHEYDHVLIATTDQVPVLNSDEVAAVRYVSEAKLKEELDAMPEAFTYWFRLIMEKMTTYHANK